MTTPNRPINAIVPALPAGDQRPTLVRPAAARGAIFSGWGPKI
jgi:hypothetical protein